MKALIAAFCFVASVSGVANDRDLSGQRGLEISPALKPDLKIQLEGKAAKFDFMASDPARHRILAAHKGTGTLKVVDAQAGKLLRSVPVGEAQGVAVDGDGGRYFVGNDAEHSVVIVDAKTFEKLGEVKVDAPVDAIAFDPKNGKVYAAADDGDHLWVVDPVSKTVVGKVKIPGIPESLEYNSSDDRIYLNIKDKNQVVKINPESNQVEQSISTVPVTSPHGLAVDRKRGLVFVAGKNGKLVAVNFKRGKVVSQTDIANDNDQIVFDSATSTIFCACRGTLSIVQAKDSGLKNIGKASSPKGAHTIALGESRSIWVVFADDAHSYFQKFVTAE